MYKQGLLVDPAKIALILSLPPLTNVKMLQVTLGHIVCKQGLLVDTAKIALILSLPPLTTMKMLQAMLGHMR